MTDCDVCIGVDSLEDTFEWSETQTRTARKPHKCCECGNVIAKGQKYEHVVWKFEGEFGKYDTCALCVEIRTVFTCGQSWYFEQLWEEMAEYAFERLTTASKCFRELSPEAKEFTLERWRKWKGLQ